MKYKTIFDYWTDNLCNGGNDLFPFHLTKGKKVLEIGCGSGNDAVRFVKSGAKYTGIDLTHRAMETTKLKIGNKGITKQMNAEFIDFPDNHFDVVYSFGVIHHTINPNNVINEMHRVLKPDGLIFIMVYNKMSFRYLVEIQILRRIAWFLHHPKYKVIRKVIPHPTKEEWLSINTDNVGCPLSRVYTKKQSEELLNKFKGVKSFTTDKHWFRIVFGKK